MVTSASRSPSRRAAIPLHEAGQLLQLAERSAPGFASVLLYDIVGVLDEAAESPGIEHRGDELARLRKRAERLRDRVR